MVGMEVRLERLKPLKAAYFHASGDNPEETALTNVLNWASSKGLKQVSGVRLFGRNTYPMDKPEPHGYEYYLTVNGDFTYENSVSVKTLPEGLYAILRFKNLFAMQDAWTRLMAWAREHTREQVGVRKGEHGWVNSGFEELLNWQEQKPPVEWVFDIWLQLKE